MLLLNKWNVDNINTSCRTDNTDMWHKHKHKANNEDKLSKEAKEKKKGLTAEESKSKEIKVGLSNVRSKQVA